MLDTQEIEFLNKLSNGRWMLRQATPTPEIQSLADRGYCQIFEYVCDDVGTLTGDKGVEMTEAGMLALQVAITPLPGEVAPELSTESGDSANEITMRAVNFTNKESLVDLLFRVQTGFISCRKAAAVLQAVHNAMELCESCCDPAKASDGQGVPLCEECAKEQSKEPPDAQP